MFLYVYLEKDVGWGKKKKSKMSLRRKIQSGQHWDRMSESDVIGELWTVSSAVNFRSNVERLSNYSDRLDEKILPTISDVTYDDLNRDLAQVNAKISIRVVGNYLRYKYEISIHKKKKSKFFQFPRRRTYEERFQPRPITSVFTAHYSRGYFAHRANPWTYDTDYPISATREAHLRNFFQGRLSSDDTVQAVNEYYPYADVITGPDNCGDLHVHASHSYLLDFNVEFCISEFYFKSAFNSLIFQLQLLNLKRKSGPQLVELERARHEFFLNHFTSLNSKTKRDSPQGTLLRHMYNRKSVFLDLAHSAPFSKDIFFFNATRSFLKRRKGAIIHLLTNPLRYRGTGYEVSSWNPLREKLAVADDRDDDVVDDDVDDHHHRRRRPPRTTLYFVPPIPNNGHHPRPPPHRLAASRLERRRRTRTPSRPNSLTLYKPLVAPHSLQDLCSVTIRRMVSLEQYAAYPNAENFKESSLTLTKSKTASNLYRALPTILAKYLESFTKDPNSEARGMAYFRCCNTIEKTETRDRKNILLGQPPYTVTYNSRAIMRNPEHRLLRNLCLFVVDRWIEPKVQSVHFYEDLTDVTSFVYRGERIVLPHELPSGRGSRSPTFDDSSSSSGETSPSATLDGYSSLYSSLGDTSSSDRETDWETLTEEEVEEEDDGVELLVD